MNKNRVSISLGCALVLMVCTFQATQAYEDYAGYIAAVATQETTFRTNHYLIANLATLEALFVAQHDAWMSSQMMPGTNEWSAFASPAELPISWHSLPSAFISSLAPATDLGVVVYPIRIRESPTSHQVQFFAGSTLIYTMPTVYANTNRYATNAVPILFGGGFDDDEIAYIQDEYAPSRMSLEVNLICDTNLFAFLYNEFFLLGKPNFADPGDTEDSDGDGVSNRDEIRWGTDPYDSGNYSGFTRIINSNDLFSVIWPAPSNRNYRVEQASNLLSGTWTSSTAWMAGNNTVLAFTNADDGAEQFFRYKIEEEDVNANGLPDWWEIKYWGQLMSAQTPASDPDGDGLDNGEELYFGYSPLISENTLIHSIYHTVIVNDNTPLPDDGTERFDFHGGGRPLGLASNASDGFGQIFGDAHSGGIYFNNDETNLYIGVSGIDVAGANAFVLFIDAKAGGVSNLTHLNGQPFAFGKAKNFHFSPTQFLPEVGIILGGDYGDGQNYTSYTVGGNDFGQGVYNLADLSHFAGFEGTGAAVSQWTKENPGTSPRAGCEIALSLSALGCSPTSTIQVAALFIGGTDNVNRWASAEVYGKSVAPAGGGFANQTFIGAPVQLATAAQSLPTVAYPKLTEEDVMLQAFFWNCASPGEIPSEIGDGSWYQTLQTQVVDFATSGFTHIYLPPPQKGESGMWSMGYDPFDHYDFGEYFQRYSTPTRFGGITNLLPLLTRITANGMLPVVDIVMNHMRQQPASKTFIYTPHNGTPQFSKTASDFHPSVWGHNDEMYPYHQTSDFGSDYFDVDQLAPNMRLGLKRWGDWLTDTIGYQAYRFDLASRMEPWTLWEWMNYKPMRGRFAVMEYWALASGREQQEWLDLTGRSAAVFDWNLQIMLKEMCESNGAFDMKRLDHPSLLGLEPDYTVTFVESHDTFAPMKHLDERGISQNKMMAYSYILFQNGLPMVYYHDYYLQPYHDGTPDPDHSHRGWPTGYFGVPLKPQIDTGIWIRQQFLSGHPVYAVTNAAEQGDLFVAIRDGGGTKSGGMLVLNDATAARSATVVTPWKNTILRDAYTQDSAFDVSTTATGDAYLTTPGNSYRVYVPLSALP